jgi:uncharacterized protein YaaQ
MAIVHDNDASNVMDILSEEGFLITKLTSTGGFLRAGNTTLISGCPEERVAELTELISKNCKSRKQIRNVNHTDIYSIDSFATHPIEITTGGATIFVLNVEEFKKV